MVHGLGASARQPEPVLAPVKSVGVLYRRGSPEVTARVGGARGVAGGTANLLEVTYWEDVGTRLTWGFMVSGRGVCSKEAVRPPGTVVPGGRTGLVVWCSAVGQE